MTSRARPLGWSRSFVAISVPTLDRRALNRATLARQMLLARERRPALEALEHLVGLQAQTTHTWYAALWSRLDGFQPHELAEALTDGRVVRLALMRSTIHLVTADDAVRLRAVLQPTIERLTRGTFGKRVAGLDLDELEAAGRELVEQQPMTFAQLGAALKQRWPDREAMALSQTVRARLALVQTPPRGVWGASGQATHTTLEAWLGRNIDAVADVDAVVFRYLAAFGPATVADVQTWSGLTRLREVVDGLAPRLVRFKDEAGRDLWDLPDAPRPDPDTPAPARLLYDFDNLLLSHADRSRVITDGYRTQVFSTDMTQPSLVLLDGFTSAIWRVTRERGTAHLSMQAVPGVRLSAAHREELTLEGLSLLDFLAPGATHDIQFKPPGPWP